MTLNKYGSTSKYRGVSWDKANSVWRASIWADGKSVKLGTFKDEEGAARAYAEAARTLGRTPRAMSPHWKPPDDRLPRIRNVSRRSLTWHGKCPAFRPLYTEDEKRGRLAHCDD